MNNFVCYWWIHVFPNYISETQTALSRIWIWLTVFISYGDNRYAATLDLFLQFGVRKLSLVFNKIL